MRRLILLVSCITLIENLFLRSPICSEGDEKPLSLCFLDRGSVLPRNSMSSDDLRTITLRHFSFRAHFFWENNIIGSILHIIFCADWMGSKAFMVAMVKVRMRLEFQYVICICEGLDFLGEKAFIGIILHQRPIKGVRRASAISSKIVMAMEDDSSEISKCSRYLCIMRQDK